MNLFNNAGSGSLFANKGGTSGGGLFQNQGAAGGGGGGGGGSLFGNQSGGGQQGGSLFGNQQKQGGSLFNQGATGSGGGLFNQGGGAGGSTGGGLFNQGAQGGGIFNKTTGGGGVFNPGAGTGGSFSLLNQRQPGGAPDLQRSKNRFQLSLTNSLRDKKVGLLNDRQKQAMESIAKELENNRKQVEVLKAENEEIVKKKNILADTTYQFCQDSKLLYMKIKQARYLVDDMKSSLATYDDLTSHNFDTSLDLLKGGRLPRLDIPSNFLVNITEYYDIRIRELKDKIGEIEELVKLADPNEDSEEYEKIIMALDELYNYYLNVAHKVIQLNEYVTSFKAQFIDYFKSQGSREVERIFSTRAPDADKPDVLGRLETISNYVLENKRKM